jgi:hypothetical protein
MKGLALTKVCVSGDFLAAPKQLINKIKIIGVVGAENPVVCN